MMLIVLGGCVTDDGPQVPAPAGDTAEAPVTFPCTATSGGAQGAVSGASRRGNLGEVLAIGDVAAGAGSEVIAGAPGYFDAYSGGPVTVHTPRVVACSRDSSWRLGGATGSLGGEGVGAGGGGSEPARRQREPVVAPETSRVPRCWSGRPAAPSWPRTSTRTLPCGSGSEGSTSGEGVRCTSTCRDVPAPR